MRRSLCAGLALLMLLTGAPAARAEALSILNWLRGWANESREASAPEEMWAALEQTGLSFREGMAEKFWETLDEYAAQGWDMTLSYPLLLSLIGMGEWDPETGEMTPYTDSFFAFDAEMFDIGGDYGTLLENVARISGGDIQIEDFRYSMDEAEEEKWIDGEMATMQVEFALNGQACRFDAEQELDWLDCRIIDYVNEILRQSGSEKALWCMYDGGQGLVVFYDDAEWARMFERETGCALAATVE